MPMWRCPHCGTPQAETARCWVCRRSSTTCSTCRHFRRSLSPTLGYCGLDRKRLPLTGAELRGCWTAAAPLPDIATPAHAEPAAADPAVRLRGFVPIESFEAGPLPDRPLATRLPAIPPPALDGRGLRPDPRTLFGDLEP
jgi:hypothetical protein